MHRHEWWLCSQWRSGTSSQTKPSTHLSVFGFLRDDRTSQSSVTWDKLKGLQKLKEAKWDPPLGHQRQHCPADTLFQNTDLQNCERTHFCCFKPPGLWEFVADLGNQIYFPEMKNIFFVIFFLKILRKTCWPPALEHGGHRDPRIHCHVLCPPVSETHRGRSTDAQEARREGNKGMESTRIPGEDQLHLSGVVEKQDAVWWYGLVFIKQEKKIQVLTTCICTCMYTYVYIWHQSMWNLLKAVHAVEDMDAPWIEGWTLLWGSKKPGRTKVGNLSTCETLIVLLYVNYTWE